MRSIADAEIALRIALFEPDIPQNAGTIIRMAACLGVPVDIIEPAGFLMTDSHFRRAGLDYVERAVLTRFPSFDAYRATRAGSRLLLLTTRGEVAYTAIGYLSDDALLLGRESAGAPAWLHAAVDLRVRIPMVSDLRSLNVAVAAAMVLGEALRQTGGWPGPTDV